MFVTKIEKSCARECGFWNPGKIFLQESGIREILLVESKIVGFGISGIPLKESGIPRTISVRNLCSTDKESKSSEWNP